MDAEDEQIFIPTDKHKERPEVPMQEAKCLQLSIKEGQPIYE